MAARLLPALALIFLLHASPAVAADVNVIVPSNGSVVNSPFLLQANSSSCQTQPTSGMAWSVDQQTDHLFSGQQSISDNVTMSNGTHTLRVKAWGTSGAYCEKDVALTVGGGVAVSSPVNGATVPNPFSLQASAPTCGGQTTSSMAFSFDSQTDNMRSGQQSINEMVNASPGQHLLRVKAWGNGGAFCDTNLSITVSAEDIVVATPSNGATVSSPFPIQATSTTCSGVATHGMAWSYDSQPDNIFSNSQSINTTATVPAGARLLRVKAWNNNGVLCEKDLNITVTAGDITVTTPTSGDDVALTFPLQASAPTCQGIATSSMAYSFDNLTDHLLSGQQSINQNVTAPGTGSHLLRVKAWNTSGGFCVDDLNINVIDSGLTPDPSATALTDVQAMPNYPHVYPDGYGSCPNNGATDFANSKQHWLNQPDCGTTGGDQYNSGSTNLVPPSSLPAGAPSDSAEGRVHDMSSTASSSGGGVRWFNSAATDTTSNHFQYDINVNIVDVNQIYNLEMDLNQAFNTTGNVHLYIFGVQCNLSSGKSIWQYTDYRTTPHWKDTNQSCTKTDLASGKWHHIQMQYHRGPNPGDLITYDAVAVDGVVKNFDCGANHVACQGGPNSSAWGNGTLGPNFQIDTFSGGHATAYVQKFYIYSWYK